MFTPRSHLFGMHWPPLFNEGVSSMLALCFQLERSQWWPLEDLRRQQLVQLREVAQHAAATVPLYQELYANQSALEKIDATSWATLPIIEKHVLLNAEDGLLSRGFPSPHGQPQEVKTSGSTGKPLRVLKSGVSNLVWQAITLREHLWHRRDLNAHLAAIRHVADAEAVGAVPPNGATGTGWGAATRAMYPDAKCSLLSVATPVDQQVDWLVKTAPTYLLTYPSNLDALLHVIEARDISLPALEQVRTISEAVDADLPERCQRILGVPHVDLYSAEEVGHIAAQCPNVATNYHVMSENVLVEVLDDDDQPCAPGETGRVIVSSLNNLATPILRYAIGDYARVGAPCACGRGLPVLERILGRRRSMLRYADGRVVWPHFTGACRRAAPFRVMQVIQEDLHHIRMLVVPEGELTEPHAQALHQALLDSFGDSFEITIERVDDIPRSKRGKLDEFVSRLD